MTHVVIPAAGLGQRFRNAGYNVPKPMIPILGKPMLFHVLDRIPDTWRTTVVVSEDDFNVGGELTMDWMNRYDLDVVYVEGRTGGAAETVMEACPQLSAELADDVMVINCDQITTYPLGVFQRQCSTFAGGILTFTEYGDPRYSYAEGWPLVVRTAEKDPISEYATAGFYFFKSWKLLANSIKLMVGSGDRFNGESYLCPAYNYVVGGVLNVNIPRESVITWGTPEEVSTFNSSPRLQELLLQS